MDDKKRAAHSGHGFHVFEENGYLQSNCNASLPSFCSGFGQSHTDKHGRKLDSATLDDIRQLVDKPQKVGKSEAQWFIPSTLPSRTFKEQEANGEYWALWADIDKDSPDFDGWLKS